LKTKQYENLLRKIVKRKARVVVVGSGYVGLPTAGLFADVGYDVTAVDVKPSVIEKLNKGVSPIKEPGLDKMILRNVQAGRLKAELFSSGVLRDEDLFIVCVQTPINNNKKPDLSFLMNALNAIGHSIKEAGSFIAVCSTIPPGTSQEKIKPLLENLSGLIADRDFYLAYVPERIAPGNALNEFMTGPRLVGGIGTNSTKIAHEVFGSICRTIIETEAAIAEVSKTAENTFRDVNIAFANQLALICEQHGADITKVIELANTHPRVNIHMPGPGVGGPCLTKDPYLLINDTEFKNHNIVLDARAINDQMPHHMMQLIKNGLNRTGKSLRNSRITVLGSSYKANVDDSRCSPAEQIIDGLLSSFAKVVVYDPFSSATFGAEKAQSFMEAIKNSDCIVIVTDHAEFKALNLEKMRELMTANPLIVDGRRIIDPISAENAGFTYYGIGVGSQNRYATICRVVPFEKIASIPEE
jgi:UDP-N-acetyl-D-mannosaminuronic acid dehydrogenase